MDFDLDIQRDIVERENVLFEIERALFTGRYNLSLKHRNIFWSHSISLLYSIWEGFTQTAFNLYVDELNKLNLNIFDYCDKIRISYMESTFKQLINYPNKVNSKIIFYQNLKNFHLAPVQPLNRVVNTESNVGLNVLNRLLETFALEPFPEHWNTYTHPNPNLKDSLNLLLKLRNDVSHGSVSYSHYIIEQDEFGRFKNLVIDLMYEIRLKMVDGLASKTYRNRI